MKRAAKWVWMVLLLVSCQNEFKTVVLLPHTPVKDQGEWPAGWIYATLSLVESERILAGDSLELSATYLIRRRVEQLCRAGQPFPRFEGRPMDCLHLLEEGALLYAVFRPAPKWSWRECKRALATGDMATVLDTGFSYVPRLVTLYGTTYTPLDLARSLYVEDAYVEHRFPSGDTTGRERIVRQMDSVLRKGHSLVWTGKNHSMHVIGMAKRAGQHYFICKDSHGTAHEGGLKYLSDDFIIRFTESLLWHK